MPGRLHDVGHRRIDRARVGHVQPDDVDRRRGAGLGDRPVEPLHALGQVAHGGENPAGPRSASETVAARPKPLEQPVTRAVPGTV